MQMTKRQIVAHDKRKAAHHEVAHAIVAIGLGLVAWAKIWPTNTTDLFAENAWIGNCSFRFAEPTQAKLSSTGTVIGLRAVIPSKRQLAAISIAGFVAECRLSDDCVDPDDVLASLDDGMFELSATDAAGLPKSYTAKLRAVETATKLLDEHDAMFKRAVRLLLRNGAVDSRELVPPKRAAYVPRHIK